MTRRRTSGEVRARHVGPTSSQRRALALWDAALRAGIELQSTNRSILSVGVGFKHRRRAGYGRRPVPCLKFLVRRKAKSPPRGTRVPKSVSFRFRGRTVRVRTDIEHARGITPSAERIVCGPKAVAGVGSLGFFAVTAAGGQYLVTAGHTFASGGRVLHEADGVPVRAEIGSWPITPSSCDEARGAPVLGRSVIGTVDKRATSFRDVHGLLVDVAVVEIENGFPEAASVLPWSIPDPVIRPLAALRLAHAEGRQERFTVFAASGQKRVRFDTIFGVEGAGLRPPGAANLNYATPLVKYRVDGSRALICGDSGASVMTEDGREIVGVHVLGDSAKGYAVPAERALAEIERVSGLALEPTSV